ncbi:cell envelope integrity protein TolA [Vibrio antiquarius]|uniref:cell envelope integrity protein TolA n=1 Tax=Vibrio diabolicus subgroup TaxID=2315253 RepID=UPI00265AED60|nr:cell envelope integrity protein TolA [Vibrio antiquarius]MCR9937270.1 cell envelope integrity protein TolA [Vibrio antiquarius]
MKDHKKKPNQYAKPIAISVGLHAILVAALLWGTDFNMSKPEPTGQMVQAVVIDPKLVQQQAKEIRQQREKAAKKEQERLDKLRREAEQLEKNRKAEEEQIRKLKEQQAKDAQAAREAEAARKAKEEAVRKAEQERLAKEAAIAKAEQERLAREKAAKEAEEKARREREAAEKAEQERIAKEKAAKEAAERERKAREAAERAERERKAQEAALDDIFAGLESESEQNQQAKNQHVQSEVDRYGAIYKQLIESRIIKDDYLVGKSCRLNVKLVPTGTDGIVSNVTVLNGDSRLCSAAKSAVAQVGNFPMPKDRDVIDKVRDINLTVEY